MSNVILATFLITGIISCILSAKTRRKIKVSFNFLSLGLTALFVAFLALLFTYSMKLDIPKREMVQISQERVIYELITIQSNSEDTEFHFYYRTEIDGVEGFEPKTISSENVFIIESNQTLPKVIENITIYDYELSEFEKWWLTTEYLDTLIPQANQSYQIYVPEGTFPREYNLT